VKSGNSLQSVIDNQTPTYHEMIKALVKDKDFYCSPDISNEKKKFLKTSSNSSKMTEISSLRQNIKEMGVLKSKELSNVKAKTTSYKKNDNLTARIHDLNYSREDLLETNKKECKGLFYLDVDMLDKDRNLFTTQMADYERYLDELKETDDKGKKKFNLNTESLHMLSFKPSANNNIIEKKEEDNNLDIIKLNKYFKSNQKGQEAKEVIIYQEQVDELYGQNTDNTGAQIVKNEILNSYFIDKNFKSKKEKLDQLISVYDLPKIEDYEGSFIII
jgi:hypothetical protein